MEKKSTPFLLVAALLLVIVRVLVHVHFSGVYVDGDQTITWLSAVDKANGQWYTPYFYGQFYNISVVAIVSAPFISLGLPVESVVPIASNVVGSLVFVFFAWYLARQKQQTAALMVLCLGLVLPAQYHFVTAMARGFAGGLAVFSIGLLCTSLHSRFIQCLGYALLLISYLINPNVLIVAFPLGLVWINNFLQEGHKPKLAQLAPIIGGVLLFISVWLLLHFHSLNNPLYEVHRLWSLEFSIDYLLNSLQSLDARFLYLFPFLPKIGSLVFFVLVAITIYLFVKKESRKGLIMSTVILFLLATLSLNKTLDGTYSTFFPYSRMYLALPFVLVLALHFVVTSKRVLVTYLIFAVGVIGFVYQFYDIPIKAKASVRGNTGVVQVIRIDKLCLECLEMKAMQDRYEADLLVFHYKTDEYTYGCKALQPSIQTLYPEYDRRSWSFVRHADTAYNTVLFLDWSLKLPEVLTEYDGKFKAIEGIHYPAFLMTDNTQSIIELYTVNSLRLRPHSK